MLKSILIENFKSYKKQTLPLAPLTLMIGANASGKSNALEAFRFLSWIVGGEKLTTIKNRINESEKIFRGEVRDLVYAGGDTFTLGAEVDGKWDQFSITFQSDKTNLIIKDEYLKSSKSDKYLYETSGVDDSGNIWVHAILPTVDHGNGEVKGGFLHSRDAALINKIDILTFTRGYDSEDEHYVEFKKNLHNVVLAISKTLFFDMQPLMMRSQSYPEDELLYNGSNLVGVLYKLSKDIKQQAHILEFIKSLPEQDIKELKFYLSRQGSVEMEVIETFGGQEKPCSIGLLSDGTLRVLAIAAALLSAPEGSTVVIEEVDNGVHPSRAKQLLKTMLQQAQQRNINLLLTTHNPALMDALPDEALGDVVFCYRDAKQGDSRLVRLSDLDDYAGLVTQGPLGELVTQGVVDRFVKHPVSAEQKKQNALDWLARLQQEEAGNE